MLKKKNKMKITPEELIVETDELGSFRTLWNNDLQMYTLAFDLSHQVKPGENSRRFKKRRREYSTCNLIRSSCEL